LRNKSNLIFCNKKSLLKSKSNAEVLNFLIDDLKIDFSEIESYNSIEKAAGKLIPGWE